MGCNPSVRSTDQPHSAGWRLCLQLPAPSPQTHAHHAPLREECMWPKSTSGMCRSWPCMRSRASCRQERWAGRWAPGGQPGGRGGQAGKESRGRQAEGMDGWAGREGGSRAPDRPTKPTIASPHFTSNHPTTHTCRLGPPKPASGCAQSTSHPPSNLTTTSSQGSQPHLQVGVAKVCLGLCPIHTADGVAAGPKPRWAVVRHQHLCCVAEWRRGEVRQGGGLPGVARVKQPPALHNCRPPS